MISMTALLGAVEQGLIYSLVALGLYLSYRVLNVADLTTDGSFTLGAASSAMLTTLGHPVQGLAVAALAGGLAGGVTAFLQTKCKVQPILAGIVTMTGLYSINLMVMGGRQNLPLLKADTVFTWAEGLLGKQFGTLALALAVVLVVGGCLTAFLGTQLGLSIRATGDNKDMVSASSINPAFTTTVGLCLANAIIALSGGLLAQQQKFSDSNLGTGMVVVGLASLIIGEVIVGRGGVARCVAGVMVGSILYRIIMAFALGANLGASNLKLVSAVIVGVTISLPALKSALAFARRKREAKKSC